MKRNGVAMKTRRSTPLSGREEECRRYPQHDCFPYVDSGRDEEGENREDRECREDIHHRRVIEPLIAQELREARVTGLSSSRSRRLAIGVKESGKYGAIVAATTVSDPTSRYAVRRRPIVRLLKSTRGNRK